MATGSNKYGECDVQDWKLFNSLDTLEQERAEAKANREAERSRKEAEAARKKVVLESEKTTLQAELANLNGLFTGKRRKEIEEKLIEIKTELENFKES